MNEIKVTCPNCGTKFDVRMQAGKAMQRIAALKAAGVDTSCMLAMQTGEVARVKDGVASIIPEDDEVFRAIRDGGTIPNGKLFRRWVTAQMFHMLADRRNFDTVLRARGMRYQWRVLYDELHAQRMMNANGDKESLAERTVWFNKDAFVDIEEDFLHYCVNVKASIYKPLEQAIARMKVANHHLDDDFLLAFGDFYKIATEHLMDKMSFNFVNAYKAAGAYFTMKNLILFHDCRFENCDEQQSMDYLRKMNAEYALDDRGYAMLGMLKSLLRHNNIDVRQSVHDWSQLRGVPTHKGYDSERFRKLKEMHPDALLLFECGGRYEAYNEDAKLLCGIMDATMCYGADKDGHDIVEAIVPVPRLADCVERVVKSGHRMALV